MKKVLISMSLTMMYFVFSGQLIAQEGCVNCENNTVNIENFASAIGTDNDAQGERSFVGGSMSQAIGDFSFAFGQETSATAMHSYAMGRSVNANGNYSLAIGKNSSANGMYSIVIGRNSTATGMGATSIGYANDAQATASFLFGSSLKATGGGSITIGMGSGTGGELINDKPYSLMVGFQSEFPTLFVNGNSDNNNDKTGKVGIGNVTDPQAKLHIRADVDESASLFLEPTSELLSGIFMIGDQNTSIEAKASDNLNFNISTGKKFIFNTGDVLLSSGKLKTKEVRANTSGGLTLGDQSGNGIFIENGANVGIGTDTPTAKLDVDGSMIVSGNAKFENNLSIGCNPNEGYLLSVKGEILSKGVTVAETVGADYVFANDYQLSQLAEVEEFIEKNNHLQDIPSAEEMIKEGVDIGKLQMKLLQKIEELTLYTIEQQKAIDRQTRKIEEMEAKMEK